MYDKSPLVDSERQRDFLRWCSASRVTEVYLGATCSMLRGCEDACYVHPAGAPRPQPNASTEGQLVAFIRALERQRVAVQLYGGEVSGEPSIRCTAAGISMARSLNTLVKTDDFPAQCQPNLDTGGLPGWRGYKLAWGISTNGFGAHSRETLSGLWSITP
eukprot:SAG31_NODE_18352_length_639_cov_0.974074_1_plen_159_part_10